MSRERSEELFVSGFPDINEVHFKSLAASANNKSHVFYLVVAIGKNIEGGKSFRLPTHQPLLVI